ncbi:MAG: FtsH protease activity modulator HflK [Gammaproteobacteria bacterium]|nr:FtsH protease activity modulator HflK [Gammaproteobacteria bacterium]
MAWNEPGGSGKDRDPWGGSDNKGPPDLDEVVKKMQDKFGAFFGRGGSSQTPGGAGGKGGGISTAGIGLILALAAIVWAIAGIYTVEEGTRGVVLQLGKYMKTTTPGLHWAPPFIQTYEIVDIENVRDARIGYRTEGTTGRRSASIEEESLMLTQDENIVDIHLAVQYKIKSASDYLFKTVDPDDTLREATESALREIIGKNNMDFVLTQGRAEIAASVQELIQGILDRYGTGLLVTSVNMQDAQPPEPVQAAFDDAVKAREDEERLKNEAEAYANDIIPRARGKAARAEEDSLAYKEQVIAQAKGETSRFSQILAEYKKAPEVTRKRLYIDAVESVMSNTSKVVIDVEGGNNLMYLPLDKMMQGAAGIRDLLQNSQGGESSLPSRSSTTQQTIRESTRGTTREDRE